MEQSNPCSRLSQLRGKCLRLKIRTNKYKNNHFLRILTDSLAPLARLLRLLRYIRMLTTGTTGQRTNDNGTMGQWDNGTMGQR